MSMGSSQVGAVCILKFLVNNYCYKILLIGKNISDKSKTEKLDTRFLLYLVDGVLDKSKLRNMKKLVLIRLRQN